MNFGARQRFWNYVQASAKGAGNAKGRSSHRAAGAVIQRLGHVCFCDVTITCCKCQRNKVGRAIVISTDFCEEAESNGDRIAIISNKTIPHCKPPIDLLFLLCGGYTIDIVLDAAADKAAIASFLRRIVPAVRVWHRGLLFCCSALAADCSGFPLPRTVVRHRLGLTTAHRASCQWRSQATTPPLWIAS